MDANYTQLVRLRVTLRVEQSTTTVPRDDDGRNVCGVAHGLLLSSWRGHVAGQPLVLCRYCQQSKYTLLTYVRVCLV
jgi:hypothetical protein